MTIGLARQGVRTILLDIEGTTTPIAFVHEELFPYARARLASFFTNPRHADDAAEVIRLLSAEHTADLASGQAPPPWQSSSDAITSYAGWLMDRDRKSPGLKLAQGLIWEDGYQRGDLRGQVFEDVTPAMREWRAAGIGIAIYSSGSELAQRRLFESVPGGDLTTLIGAFFDTRVGAKVEASSYARIAAALGRKPAEVLFVSDITRELAAARAAGVQVVLSIRPGNAPQPDAAEYRAVRSFDEL